MKKSIVFKSILASLITSITLYGCDKKENSADFQENNQYKGTIETEMTMGVISGSSDSSDDFVMVDSAYDGDDVLYERTCYLPIVENVLSETDEVLENEGENTDIIQIENLNEDCDISNGSDVVVSNSPEEDEIIPVYVPVEGITLTVYEVNLVPGSTKMPYVTVYPINCTDKGEIWTSSDTSVATVDKYGNIKGVSDGNCVVTVCSTDNNNVFATVNVTVETPSAPPATATAECTYISGILIANKTYALPADYAPGTDATANANLMTMFADAKNEGILLWVKSAYRSYTDQRIIYNNYVARDGVAAADQYSARPGHSEHQTGLAFDLNSLSQSFGDTKEGKWLAQNCHKYGFIIRYPKNKEHITGYMYEPWHVRYLGVETASQVYASGLCLEEYLGITSKYSY